MLSSQAGLPTFKHIDFSSDVRRVLKVQCFRSDDVIDSVLGLSWHHVSVFVGRLGSSLGGVGGFLGTPGGTPITLIIMLGPS